MKINLDETYDELDALVKHMEVLRAQLPSILLLSKNDIVRENEHCEGLINTIETHSRIMGINDRIRYIISKLTQYLEANYDVEHNLLGDARGLALNVLNRLGCVRYDEDLKTLVYLNNDELEAKFNVATNK